MDLHQLTPEQLKKLNRLGFNYFLKSIWNGVQNGLMAVLLNLILFMANSIWFESSEVMSTLGSIVIAFYVLKRMLSTYNEDTAKFKDAVKEITKTE